MNNIQQLVIDGEFDQGPDIPLFFQKTFMDIQEAMEFWQWMRSEQAMAQVWNMEIA